MEDFIFCAVVTAQTIVHTSIAAQYCYGKKRKEDGPYVTHSWPVS